MKRREFMLAVGGAAAWPLAVQAEQKYVPVVALLHSVASSSSSIEVTAFRTGLREGGYTEEIGRAHV